MITARGFLDTEFFHAAIEGLAAEAELARRLRHDVAVLGERPLDSGAVERAARPSVPGSDGRQVQRRRVDGAVVDEQARARCRTFRSSRTFPGQV